MQLGNNKSKPVSFALLFSAFRISHLNFDCLTIAPAPLLTNGHSYIMHEEQAAHRGCRVKHGRQGRTAAGRSHRWGQKGGGDVVLWLRKHGVIHRSGDRGGKWERHKPQQKNGAQISRRTERRGRDRLSDVLHVSLSMRPRRVSWEIHFNDCSPGDASSPFTTRVLEFNLSLSLGH